MPERSYSTPTFPFPSSPKKSASAATLTSPPISARPRDSLRPSFVKNTKIRSDHRLSDVALASENEQTVLTFTVTGIGVGKATITIKGADGKTESNALQFTINEKDTSRTVYVTPYGEKYHYSAACAGCNATATTENKAARKTGDGFA